MEHPPHFTSAWVTGASSGIGAAFARALARRGTQRLVLVARREERLHDVAAALAGGAETVCRKADLADADTVASLARQIEAEPPDLLVHAAGFGTFGPFVDHAVEAHLRSVDLHVRSLVHLSHAFVTASLRREQGALVHVASTAGYVPVPYQAVYAAAKSFGIQFGEALYEELRRTPVRVLTVCPGFVETEFAGASGTPDRVIAQRGVQADDIAESALVALAAGRRTVAHGMVTQAAGLLGRTAPRGLVLRVVGAWMRRGLAPTRPSH